MISKSPDVSPATAAIAAVDIINSATPIELGLLGIHPRLLCVRHPFAQLRKRLDTEPWKRAFEDLQRDGEKLLTVALPDRLIGMPFSVFDVRGIGGHLISLALLYRLTEDPKYRDRISYLMQRLSDQPDWGDSLIYGHWAQGFSIALDWLWHDFDDAARRRHVETLYHRTRHVFEKWASYRAGDPFGYTWNIASVVLGGITATAACLYGERSDVAPFANLAWEKMRCQSLALGPDGVSPEGIMYGGYYASYLTVNFLLADELFGFNLYGTTPWLSRYALSLHAHSLPRASWKADDAFFMQGDAHGNIFGLESVLRVIASAAKDGTAQWLADELVNSGYIGMGPFSLLLYDPDVKPLAPLNRPPFDLMEDYGIAVMRSDWSGTESACAIKCGPNVGHHAARLYSHPLGGGHMQPNNGEIQIFAHGEWILTHPGYVYKNTAFHNTLLINGAGQYGEKSEWFEDLPYRQCRRYPFLERSEHHVAWDYCIADLTQAYPEELSLRQLRRHLLYIRPDVWIIVDALESDVPLSPTLLFHTGFPVQPAGVNTFAGSGQKVGCRLRFHVPALITTTTEDQTRIHTGGHAEGTMPLLRMSPKESATRHLCVTSVQAFDATSGMPDDLRIEVSDSQDSVHIREMKTQFTVTVYPFSKKAPAPGRF
jgi:hypothetical protein